MKSIIVGSAKKAAKMLLDDIPVQPRSNPSKEESALSKLQNEKKKLEDKIKEDRFFFIFAIVILVDLHFFVQMETWGSAVSIALLQVIALIAYGSRQGVDDLFRIVNALLARIRPGPED